tara:strand:+ start:1373 stop:2176 length:804 start_codon:yes stop_codon:yes gene_type:complete
MNVVFFDDRALPDVAAMQEVAGAIRRLTPGVRLHALTADGTPVPGLITHPIQLPPHQKRMLRAFGNATHGPGRSYIKKVFIPWMLTSLARAIVFDTDVAVFDDLSFLWKEFDRFGSALVGLADEQNELYKPLQGVNGGVQLLDLAAIRASRRYNALLARWTRRLGYLGDQTFYTYLRADEPDLVIRIGCRWNRQLSPHFGFTSKHVCDAGCAVLHANHMSVKCVAKEALASTCARGGILRAARCLTPAQHASLQTPLKLYFRECCAR